jgi:AraC family transcriptional regulator, regulatory protein of adaptative response / methylated-DNA-[protein]-cysteine methyltransferase
MQPRQFRSGGEQIAIRYVLTRCSLGELLIAATELGVCAILLGDDPAALRKDLARRFPKAFLSEADDAFADLVAQVVTLIDAPRTGTRLPLDLRGTAFQQRVWQALLAIPPGHTASYTDIAARIGAPRASRAVAGACAANHLAVAVPCHRVLRQDGELSGYRWGVARKRALLARERGEEEG